MARDVAQSLDITGLAVPRGLPWDPHPALTSRALRGTGFEKARRGRVFSWATTSSVLQKWLPSRDAIPCAPAYFRGLAGSRPERGEGSCSHEAAGACPLEPSQCSAPSDEGSGLGGGRVLVALLPGGPAPHSSSRGAQAMRPAGPPGWASVLQRVRLSLGCRPHARRPGPWTVTGGPSLGLQRPVARPWLAGDGQGPTLRGCRRRPPRRRPLAAARPGCLSLHVAPRHTFPVPLGRLPG